MPITPVLAALVSTILALLAALHVYWGYGGLWPARRREDLGPMVVGTAPRSAMPNLAACLAVAGLLVTAAILISAAGFLTEPSWVWRVGAAGVGVVLAARGVSGYFDGRLRPGTRAQPFYRLNRRIYSPLCLALAGMIALVLA